MKYFLKVFFTTFLLIMIANLGFAGNLTSIRIVSNGVEVTVEGYYKSQILLYVQEDHGRRNSTLGTIFWEKKVFTFPNSGRFILPVDLHKAKEGQRYRIVFVDHSSVGKLEGRATVRGGKFH